MKFLKKFFCCITALAVSSIILYADILSAFPGEITMYCHEVHNSKLGIGVNIGNIPEDVFASATENKITPTKTGTYTASLKIGAIPFKAVRINITDRKNLYVSGDLIGLRIYNNGLIVTNLAPVCSNGTNSSPAQKSGILPGDIIMEINGEIPKESSDVSSLLSDSTTLTLKRNNTIKKLDVTPVRDDNDGKLKIGVWVRDSSAGVGTMTYIDKDTLTYGALGHGISDSDTGIMFDVHKGTIEKSRVISIEKGKKGDPGQINGSFSHVDEISGTVTKNCEAGIFGDIFPHADVEEKLYPVGVMSQVEIGDATILSTVGDKTEEYQITILRSMPFGSATKGLSIEITDPRLLEKTGGIIQGMSGSPIIQNGRLIGAVTHVLVNDPTRGYGIFIENMLAEAEKIK